MEEASSSMLMEVVVVATATVTGLGISILVDDWARERRVRRSGRILLTGTTAALVAAWMSRILPKVWK